MQELTKHSTYPWVDLTIQKSFSVASSVCQSNPVGQPPSTPISCAGTSPIGTRRHKIGSFPRTRRPYTWEARRGTCLCRRPCLRFLKSQGKLVCTEKQMEEERRAVIWTTYVIGYGTGAPRLLRSGTRRLYVNGHRHGQVKRAGLNSSGV